MQRGRKESKGLFDMYKELIDDGPKFFQYFRMFEIVFSRVFYMYLF